MRNNIKKNIFILFLLACLVGEEDINKAMDLYMQGELSLLVDDIKSAEKYFNQALNYSPNNSQILLSLLEIKIRNKNFIGIETILEKYLILDKLDIKYSLEIIELYKLFNKTNLLDIIDLLIINNNSIELKFAQAEVLMINEKWEELLLLYSDIYINEENEEVLNTLVNIGLMIEESNLLHECLKRIWDKNKNNIYVLELLIQFSYLSNDPEIGVYLDELMEYQPDNEFGIMILAEINISKEKFLDAIALLNSIQITEKTPLDFYKMLLICYSNLNDYKNEIRLSNEIILKFPDNPIGYESLAISYLSNSNYIKAIDILNDAIEKFPEEYYFYYYSGLSYKKNFKNKEAISYFLKALEIDADLKNVMYELAELYNLESNYNASDSLFTILLEKNINDAVIMNDYAYLIANREFVEMDQLKFALELSKQSVSIIPDSPEYLDTIGWIYYKLGQYDIALDYLLKSQSLDKQNSIILEHIGDVYLKLEKYEKALKIYNRIMIKDPNNNKVLKKIDLLNEK